MNTSQQLDALAGDDGLLGLEHGVKKELVQLLVGKVDAQLRRDERGETEG